MPSEAASGTMFVPKGGAGGFTPNVGTVSLTPAGVQRADKPGLGEKRKFLVRHTDQGEEVEVLD
jgi:hypothetical protein